MMRMVGTMVDIIVKIVDEKMIVNPRPDMWAWCNPLRFFADSEKKKRRRVAPPGFEVPYGTNLAQLLEKN